MSDTSHIMFSRSEKYIAEQRGNWQRADRQERAGYFWYETVSVLKNGNFLRNFKYKYRSVKKYLMYAHKFG